MASARDVDGALWWRVVAGFAAALLAVALAGPLLTLTRHIPLSYNEGWNAYFAMRAVDPAAGPLYPPASALISNNYPPLSFFVFGVAARLTGDPIVAGRVIALVAMVAASGLAGLIARQLGVERRWAIAAAAAMLLYASALYWRYAGMADPQWLAQAVMLAGMALLLRGGAGGIGGRDFASGTIAAAALVMAAALLIKHNLLGAPAAVAVWLLLVDRRAALVWGVAFAATLALALAAITAEYGDAFSQSVLHHRRVFSATLLVDNIPNLLRLLPLIVVAGLLAIARDRDRATVLVVMFAAAALGCGIVQRGGEGVSYNAYFETLAALSIAAALAVSKAARRRVIVAGRDVSPGMIAALVALPLVIAVPGAVARATTTWTTLGTREAAWLRLERDVAAMPGPVACELLATCFWAGKPFTWDFFNAAQRFRTGTPIAPLVATIRAQRFAAIALTRRPGFAASDGERLPRPLPRLIEACYRPALAAPEATVLMIPRRRSCQ